MFRTSSGMRSSRGTPIEGTAPRRLMMSENRSSSVISASIARARASAADVPVSTPAWAVTTHPLLSALRYLVCVRHLATAPLPPSGGSFVPMIAWMGAARGQPALRGFTRKRTPSAASVLQAHDFRGDVTVFRLNAMVVGENRLRARFSAEYGGMRIHDRGGS